MAAVKAQLDDSYLKSMDLGLKIQTDAANAPFMEADKAAWQKLNQEATQTLNSWKDRGDLENALPELYRYAGTVGTKAKALADEKKKRDEFIATLNDPKLELTDDIRRAKIAQADRMYKGAEFDEFGRNLNSYTPLRVSKSVNNLERAQQALRTVTGDANATLEDFDTLDASPGMTAYKVGSEIKYVSTAKLLNHIRQAMAIDSEWANSIEQEAEARAFLENETLTPEVAAQYLQTAKGPEAEAARELAIKYNLSPEQAILKASQEKHKQSLVRSIEAFAQNHANQQTSTTSSVGPTEGQKLEAQFNKQAKLQEHAAGLRNSSDTEAATIIGKSSTTNVESWAKTGEEVFDKAAKTQISDEALKAKEDGANKILSNPNSSEESKVQANADLIDVKNARASNQITSKYIQEVQDRLRQKALDEIQPGTTLAGIKKADRDAKWKALNKIDISETGMSHKDLFLAIERGDVKFDVKNSEDSFALGAPGSFFLGAPGSPSYDKPPVTMIFTSLSKASNKEINEKQISSKTAGFVYRAYYKTQSTLGKKVDEKAKTLSTEGISLTTTAVPIVKEAEVKAIRSLLVGATALDISGTTPVPADELEGVDWSKTSEVSWIPELNKVRATVSTADGASKTYLFDATGMNLAKVKGGQLMSNPDPFVAALGAATQSERMPQYIAALNQVSGLIKTNPLTPGEPIMYKGTAIGFQRLRDGSYAAVDLSTNKVIRKDLSMLNVVGFLEVSLKK
ncbi:MAG: hypothetical protein EKK63_14640 [Acinetobacter sp.]|uniref:hypothetical protein n=1 Tax=Acinetobacter sp. TaxID=472 RepID=UPI000F9E700C|nr:hypothetical protein [Acinetobacter sp.]RUP37535.1 MAG: hypothetical protein EKK63_14640 [Acinetobacter sp.]